MPLKIKILFSLGLLLLNACSVQEKTWESVSPVFVSEEAKQHISSTRVVVSIDQDKRLGIPVMGQRTSHQYFGTVGKLAESGEERFKNDLSEEQRRLLRKVDLAAFRFETGNKFRTAIEQNINSIEWLKVSSVINHADLQISDIESMVQTQDEDALLLIDTRYLMAIDFSNITVFSYVTLYAHEDTLAKIARNIRPYEDPPTLYKNLFSYEFRLQGNYPTADDALKGWDNNEGEMVQKAISESITDLTTRIVEDLSYKTIK